MVLAYSYMFIALLTQWLCQKYKINPALTGVTIALLGITSMVVLAHFAQNFGWVKL